MKIIEQYPSNLQPGLHILRVMGKAGARFFYIRAEEKDEYKVDQEINSNAISNHSDRVYEEWRVIQRLDGERVIG